LQLPRLGALCSAILSQRLPATLSRLAVGRVAGKRRSPRRTEASRHSVRIATKHGDRRVMLKDWRAPESDMSANSRAFIRRMRKIADREGKVTVEVVSPDESTVDNYLEQVYEEAPLQLILQNCGIDSPPRSEATVVRLRGSACCAFSFSGLAMPKPRRE
jgi:hypothetical protein